MLDYLDWWMWVGTKVGSEALEQHKNSLVLIQTVLWTADCVSFFATKSAKFNPEGKN